MSNHDQPQSQVTQEPEGSKAEASSDPAPRQYKAGELRSVATKDIPALALITHGSCGSRDQGTHASTLELFNWGDPLYYQVEWDIPSMEATEHIGCTFEWVSVGMEAKKSMIDYDGVMAMPNIVYEFLLEQGFLISEDFKP